MSERVIIGGIGKSPAIDKIHRFSKKGLKQKIVKKMEKEMLKKYTDSLKKYTYRIPMEFKKADWKGTLYGNKQERYALEKNYLPQWKDLLTYTETLEKSRRGKGFQTVSLLSKAPGSVHESRGKSDFYSKPLGQTFKGERNIFCNMGDTTTHQLDISRKHSGLIYKNENKNRDSGLVFLPYRGDRG